MVKPKNDYILGKDYTIKWQPFPEMEDHGTCNTDYATIRVNSSFSLQQQRDSLLHESLHGMFNETGLGFDYEKGDTPISEEQIIRRLTPVLLHWMRTNPEILDFLLS